MTGSASSLHMLIFWIWKHSQLNHDMPLRAITTADPALLATVPEEYLIFFSSRDESGKLWCPVRASPPKA